MSEPGPEPQPFEQTAEGDALADVTDVTDVTDVADVAEPAPFGRRVLALLVDGALSVLAAGMFARPQLWSSAVFIAQATFFLGLFAETLGMRILGLRCVREDSLTADAPNGLRIGLPRAFLRAVLLSLVLPAVVMDKRGRGYHDKWTGSIVVRARLGADG